MAASMAPLPRGGPGGGGVVFRLDAAGTLTALHTFAGADGDTPHGGVTRSSDGGFIGTTTSGGSSYNGTVFTLDATGSLSASYSFTGANGPYPNAAPILASDGNVYGTTARAAPWGHRVQARSGRHAQDAVSLHRRCRWGEPPRRPDSRRRWQPLWYRIGRRRRQAGTVFKLNTGGTLTTLQASAARRRVSSSAG